jgi:uncharacterized membrane protein YdjX (TVP38/TMEM64 family)
MARSEQGHYAAMTRKNKWSLLAVAAVVAAISIVILSDVVDWHELRQSLESMERGPLLVFVAVMPLFGFSVALVYLVVGAVFGGWLGLAVVAGITAIHLLGSHWIGRRVLRAPVQRFLKRRSHRLPELLEGEEWAVALMAALVPGLPYFVRNYLLAVSDIPLRIYFWVCWPVYVLRSSVVIFLGDYSGDISVLRVTVLVSVLAVKVAICAGLIFWLRGRHKAKRAALPAALQPARAES